MRTNVFGRSGGRRLIPAAALAWAAVAGCSTSDERPYPSPRLGPVGQIERAEPPRYSYKPLPGSENAEPPAPPFYDAPLVYQRPPEQQAFVDAYNAVRRPKLAIFVNRSLLGDGLPVEAALADPPPPTGDDPVRGNPFRGDDRRDDRPPPDPIVRPGVYDEAYAKQIDYATIENVLTQWLAADGQTTILSPATVRERLSPDEVRRLQENRPRMLGELVKELNADVLIYVQARPTRQTDRGLEVRLNAEAINIQGGEQIARATVLVPPPLDTEKVNRFTRFVARKLMADMTMTWTGPGPGPAGSGPRRDGGPAVDPPPTGTPRNPSAPPSPSPDRPADLPPPVTPGPATPPPPPTNPAPAPPAAPTGGEARIPADAVLVPTPSARDAVPPAPVPADRPSDSADRPGPAGDTPPADRSVPAEKPSILDRPSNNTGQPQPPSELEGEPVQSPPVRKPAEQYPPPPASSGRQPD